MSNPSGKVTTLLPKDKKESDGGADDSKKRGLSPADDADDAGSESRRSKRKRAKVCITGYTNWLSNSHSPVPRFRDYI